MSGIAKQWGKRQDIDWGTVEAEYVTTNISVSALAKKWGVSYYTMRDHAGGGKWADKRKAYQLDVTSAACEKAKDERAEKLAGMLRASDGLSDLIARTVDKLNRLDRELDDKPVDCRIIKDLTLATRDLTSVIRDLYDLPTEGEQLARKIALERLQLEKGRTEQNEQVRIRFEAEEGQEEWAR